MQPVLTFTSVTALPPIVAKLTDLGGWIIGSAADPKSDLTSVRDWDVVIPLSEWNTCSRLVPMDAKPNTFGGWKIKDGDNIIDVWPDDLFRLCINHRMQFAWQPKYGARWARI